MHPTSLENMAKCRDKYASSLAEATAGPLRLVDVGGADVNGSYKSLFENWPVEYLTVDLDGTDADIKLSDPYKIPLDDQTADIVLCGQMFEHCEFFWLTFTEMTRLLKPNGYLFLIAPSSGPIHQYPVDCYRFYPDAFRALAKYGKCNLIEMWLDLRGPWRDLVGIFRQADAPLPLRPIQATAAPAAVAVDHFGAPPEAEILRGELPYLDVLNSIHRTLEPLNYLEIGVRHGRSLRLGCNEGSRTSRPPISRAALPESVAIFFRWTASAFFSAAKGSSAMAITANFASGILSILGDTLDNPIVAGRDAMGNILINNGAVPITGGAATVGNTTAIQASGSDGNDTISLDETNGVMPAAIFIGGIGNDVLIGGSGDDTFIWNPGDGSDTVEGQAGSDTLQFNGSNAAERIAISANGGRVLFTRDIGNIAMDLNGVEHLHFNALGSADFITVKISAAPMPAM